MRTIFAFLLLATPALAEENGPVTLDEAVKGLKGSGPLQAKIEIEQAGRPLGALTCELYDKQAPKTVANFAGLARGVRAFKDPKSGQWVKRPFYDGLAIYRVIPEFLIQGGDPKGDGTGDPGFTFEDEPVADLKMDKPGLLAMANKGPGTNGSQFFITEKPAPWLSGKYTIFGACEPVDLVAKIARVPHQGQTPSEPLVTKKVTLQRGKKK